MNEVERHKKTHEREQRELEFLSAKHQKVICVCAYFTLQSECVCAYFALQSERVCLLNSPSVCVLTSLYDLSVCDVFVPDGSHCG